LWLSFAKIAISFHLFKNNSCLKLECIIIIWDVQTYFWLFSFQKIF
jgi:hypothetical protein